MSLRKVGEWGTAMLRVPEKSPSRRTTTRKLVVVGPARSEPVIR
jgi:hypothetical protein